MKHEKRERGADGWEKEFLRDFRELSERHNGWTAWQDFVELSACAFANSVDMREAVWRKREDLYLKIAGKYSREELECFVRMLSDVTMALEEKPGQDFLGKIFMDLEFGGRAGQFFTPLDVAEMMSVITMENNIRERLSSDDFVSVSDMACGAGCMLIAFADVCKNRFKVNYQQKVFFVAQDVDPIVAKMCYIQLSLLGCAGYVVVGNSITEPVRGSLLNPVYERPEDIWFTPFYFMPVWQTRGALELTRNLFQTEKTEKTENTQGTDGDDSSAKDNADAAPRIRRESGKPPHGMAERPKREPSFSFSIRDFFKKKGRR